MLKVGKLLVNRINMKILGKFRPTPVLMKKT